VKDKEDKEELPRQCGNSVLGRGNGVSKDMNMYGGWREGSLELQTVPRI
jgi:hypothetical protein